MKYVLNYKSDYFWEFTQSLWNNRNFNLTNGRLKKK